MRCPYCEYNNTRVTDSRERETGEVIWRRRFCPECEKRFSTYERVEGISIVVCKRDGKKELYHRDKVLGGLLRACKKRPVTHQQLEEIVNSLEQNLRAKEVQEISTGEVGEFVMDCLKSLDNVAYLRFASVYKDFKNVDDFVREMGYFINESSKEQDSNE